VAGVVAGVLVAGLLDPPPFPFPPLPLPLPLPFGLVDPGEVPVPLPPLDPFGPLLFPLPPLPDDGPELPGDEPPPLPVPLPFGLRRFGPLGPRRIFPLPSPLLLPDPPESPPFLRLRRLVGVDPEPLPELGDVPEPDPFRRLLPGPVPPFPLCVAAGGLEFGPPGRVEPPAPREPDPEERNVAGARPPPLPPPDRPPPPEPVPARPPFRVARPNSGLEGTRPPPFPAALAASSRTVR
jgi:hypothetical protein